MAGSSRIEWTEMTWNPVTGCTKVSQGCKNCYAERMAKRLQAMGVPQYANGFRVSLARSVLLDPYGWRNPRIVFVNSMSDLFHPSVPTDYIREVFEVMNSTPHIYQVLTKRPERLLDEELDVQWTPNIWMGVSVESQAVVHRIDLLRESAAANKFLSLEPLLGPLEHLDLRNIHWVIVGGESGPRARPMLKAWVQSIRHQCEESAVPFFFKQWGTRVSNTALEDPTAKKGNPNYAKGGCQIDGEVLRAVPC